MIRIKIEFVAWRFADSWLAKLLIKLARFRNWNPSKHKEGVQYDYGCTIEGTPTPIGYLQAGSYISYDRWNFRLASKIATAIKRWEENREADKMRKRFAPVMKMVKPETSHPLGSQQDMVTELSNKYPNPE